MKQYNSIKAKHPDALLLFRVGDFYETFSEDAIKASKVLGIVLTKRANGAASFVELAGFPHHSLDTYLPKLVRAGLRVAICDQLEDPKLTKKIVKRGVTELVTPGVSFNDNVLEQKSNNFLAALHFDKKIIGISLLDISTGEFLMSEGSKDYVDKLLQNFSPSEVLFDKRRSEQFTEQFGSGYCTFTLDDWVFSNDYSDDLLQKQFETTTLKGFGVEDIPCGKVAAGAVLHYLAATHHDQTSHIKKLSRIERDKYVWMDKFTIRNLDLYSAGNEEGSSLLSVIDKTRSPMGARMLRRWISMPLKDEVPIQKRLNIVEYIIKKEKFRDNLKNNIDQIGDLERIISKVAAARINPREVVQLKRALSALEPIKESCKKSKNQHLLEIADQLDPCAALIEKIDHEIQEDPPFLLHKGGVISEGVSKELDDLRSIAFSGKDHLLKIQQREIENTGITSLKINFNNVFGYYIEVTNKHKDKVPQDWIRKQTLVNAERYITEELKKYESKILGAEEKILELESSLFSQLVENLISFIAPIQQNAFTIGYLDCLCSFSTIALANDYSKPKINDSMVLDIKQGRHPVIEATLPPEEEYVSNDVFLDDTTQQIMIITGPNMSGKSALLRQTALIVLMAQMGSYVPAAKASIGLVDKIFTRVGASDNISIGESTFMVEMNETASILNNLSERSLILLDEIGRGTSTYDGVSIAWAITEYLHDYVGAKAKTLFATHYHEMNELTKSLTRVKNYNVSVKEIDNKIIFLRKLVEGGTEHSFGIHVAKIAGMPKSVITRAKDIMNYLESSHANPDDKGEESKDAFPEKEDLQLNFFQLNDPSLERIKDEIDDLDINTLTPIEALLKINELKKMLPEN
ncbi:MAG: DNA mismatch repair protein MutS [Bacteroidetes bacterium]|nr:MAG: DNA mismatch repair protein MutS [Bacteroidota bacterium]